MCVCDYYFIIWKYITNKDIQYVKVLCSPIMVNICITEEFAFLKYSLHKNKFCIVFSISTNLRDILNTYYEVYTLSCIKKLYNPQV